MGDCEDKLLISCLDIDEKVLSSKSLGVIKRVTGDGKVSGEAKYKSAKEIIARFKFVFATNFGFTSQKHHRCTLRTSEHRSMYSYVRLTSIDVQLRTSEHHDVQLTSEHRSSTQP